MINIKPLIYNDIKGYLIDEYGNVWSEKTQQLLKPIPNHKGYLRVCLMDGHNNGKWVFVHKLVALNFLDLPTGTEENCIDHIDGNKLNNHYSNLRWINNLNNMRAAFHNGLYDSRDESGCQNASNIYSEEQIRQVIELLLNGESYKNITHITGVKSSTIGAIKNKRQWACLTKNVDFGVSYYEKKYPDDLKQQICEDIRLKLSASELQEKYNINLPAIKYFKQKVKHNF